MPLYDYICAGCGPFRAWQTLARADAPAACPDCEARAPRAIAAPFVANMNPHSRIAHQRNEKSAHEPQTMSRKQLDKAGAKRSGGSACHHGHGHGHKHAHGGGRPWMIGH